MKKTVLALIFMLIMSVSVWAEDISSVLESLKLGADYTSYSAGQNGAESEITLIYPDKTAYIVTNGGIVTDMYVQKDIALLSPLPVISKEDAKGAAVSFLQSAARDITGEFDLSKGEITYNGNYSVVFYRKIRGITYSGDTLSVTVDSTDGSIVSYNRVYSENTGIIDFDGVVSPEDVYNVFKKGGLTLQYAKRVENGRVYVYPVYAANPLVYYNAADGSAVVSEHQTDSRNYFDVTAMYEKTNDVVYSGEDILSASQTQQLVRQMPELGITEEYVPKRARYLKTSGGRYLIVLEYLSENDVLSVTVDAHSGIVCEFNKEPQSEGIKKSGNEIAAAVNSYISAYMSEYMPLMKLESVSYGEKTVFLYERIVNGLPFKSNGLCIAADEYANITNISFLWDDIDFPDTTGVISPDEAYEIFKNKCGFEIRYIEHGGEKIPAYAVNSITTGIIDAFSGEVLGYDGKPMAQKKYLAYIDLDTHYSKPQVEKMADCDIYVSRGNVALADPILQKDYLLLISPYLPEGKPIIENFGELTEGQLEMLYNAFLSAGVLTEDEFDPTGYVTRENAAAYFMKTIGYGELGAAEEIFKKHFSDSDEISKPLSGYAELAAALKIMSGSEGRFMPKEYISNGDSLIMVYNYLSGGLGRVQ